MDVDVSEFVKMSRDGITGIADPLDGLPERVAKLEEQKSMFSRKMIKITVMIPKDSTWQDVVMEVVFPECEER